MDQYSVTNPTVRMGMALPIDYIGPSPMSGGGFGAEALTDFEDAVEIEGPDIKPAPMIPPEIDMSDNAQKRLCNYIRDELSECEMERFAHMERFARLKRKYRTKYPEYAKNFPLPNSSNITIPVIKTNTDALKARLYQTIMAGKPPASVRTKDPMFADFANDWEEFLDLYSDEKLDVESVFDTATTECIKLGTAVTEVTRCLERRKVVSFDPIKQTYVQNVEELYNGPIIYNIPIEDFWIRTEFQNVQKAPWCGKVLRLTWSEIKDMAIAGELDPERINDIWKLPVSGGNDVPEGTKVEEKIERMEPSDRQTYRLFELFIRWDVDADGIDEEIIVYYHWESNTLLRRKFNTFKKGRRPFIVWRYKLIEYRFYGEGMAELLEQLQEEISTQHNQRIDNATLASLKLILTSKPVQGLRPGDPLWGGKIINTKGSDPRATVDVFTLGEIYPSTIENERIAQGYAREVSGVGEAALGNAQPVSRTTAAAQLSLLEEQNRRFDSTLKLFRRAIRDTYNHITDLFNQTGTGGLAEQWFGDIRGQRIETYITMPADALSQKIKVQVISTKATVNREVEMQTNIALMNLIIQNGQQLMGLVQQLAPQVLPVVANLLLESIRPIYKKVLQYADAPNAEDAIKVLTFIEGILPSPEDMGGMAQQAALSGGAAGANGAGAVPGINGGAGQPGGVGSPAGAATDARLGDLIAAIGQANRRLPRTAGQGGGRR